MLFFLASTRKKWLLFWKYQRTKRHPVGPDESLGSLTGDAQGGVSAYCTDEGNIEQRTRNTELSMTVGRSLFAVPCSEVSIQLGGREGKCSVFRNQYSVVSKSLI